MRDFDKIQEEKYQMIKKKNCFMFSKRWIWWTFRGTFSKLFLCNVMWHSGCTFRPFRKSLKSPQYKESVRKALEKWVANSKYRNGYVDKSIKWIFRQWIRTQLELGVMRWLNNHSAMELCSAMSFIFFFVFFFPGSQYARPRARERVRVGDGGPRAAECGEEAHCLSLPSLALSQTSSSWTAFLQTRLSSLMWALTWHPVRDRDFENSV